MENQSVNPLLADAMIHLSAAEKAIEKFAKDELYPLPAEQMKEDYSSYGDVENEVTCARTALSFLIAEDIISRNNRKTTTAE